jgi:hypothetical protein
MLLGLPNACVLDIACCRVVRIRWTFRKHMGIDDGLNWMMAMQLTQYEQKHSRCEANR